MSLSWIYRRLFPRPRIFLSATHKLHTAEYSSYFLTAILTAGIHIVPETVRRLLTWDSLRCIVWYQILQDIIVTLSRSLIRSVRSLTSGRISTFMMAETFQNPDSVLTMVSSISWPSQIHTAYGTITGLWLDERRYFYNVLFDWIMQPWTSHQTRMSIRPSCLSEVLLKCVRKSRSPREANGMNDMDICDKGAYTSAVASWRSWLPVVFAVCRSRNMNWSVQCSNMKFRPSRAGSNIQIKVDVKLV